MESSFNSDQSTAKEMLPPDETNIASTSRINPKQPFRAQTNYSYKESSQRGSGGSGGYADSCGFSFEPLPEVNEENSMMNSFRSEHDHHKRERWNQQDNNISQAGPPNIGPPPNLDWSLIKETITAFPGLNQKRNPFDGRNMPAFSVNKPTPDVLPFRGNTPSFDASPFGLKNAIPNVPPFGDHPVFGEALPSVNNQNKSNQPSYIPPIIDNRTISPFGDNNQSSGILPFGGNSQSSGILPFVGNNQSSGIPPFGSNNQSTGILPFGGNNPVSGFLAFRGINTPADISPFCNKSPAPEIPLVGSVDTKGTKKKSRWKQLAASFAKTEESSSSEMSQLETPLDSKSSSASLSNDFSSLPLPSVSNDIPPPLPIDSRKEEINLNQLSPTPSSLEQILPNQKRMEDILATSRSKSIRKSMEEMLPTPEPSDDSLKSTDMQNEEEEDTHTDGSLKIKVSPKSKVLPFNVFKPVKLPSAFSFLQMDPITKTDKTTEDQNDSQEKSKKPSCDEKTVEMSHLETSLDSKSSSVSHIHDFPPLPPPSDLTEIPPPLPFDPVAFPPPPPSPSVVHFPPPPPSPSAIHLPPLPPTPSAIHLPNDLPPIPPPVELNLIQQPPPSFQSQADELNLIPPPPLPSLLSEASEGCALEDIPIPTCSGFNFSIAGVQPSKVSRIGLNNPNSFGALMLARKRIKENKNIFNEEEDSNEVCDNEDDDKNNSENVETSPKHEPTSIGVIDNKRRATEKIIKNGDKHEKSEENAPIERDEVVSKTTLSDTAQKEKNKSSMESDIDDIFPISKDGYGAAKQLNKVKKALVIKQASKKVSESNVECSTPVDPKILCKLRASKVLTSLGNPTSELVTPAKDSKNDEPKKVPVLYGGYVTKLANQDELKTFTNNEIETKFKRSNSGDQKKKDRSRSRGRRSRSPKYSRSKSMKSKDRRSRSRSHSSGNKKRLKKTRSRSRSYSSKRSKRSGSRSRVDSSKRKEISRSQSRSDRYERKRQSKRMRSRSKSKYGTTSKRERKSKSRERASKSRKSKSMERSSKSRKHKKMKSKKSKHKSKSKQRKEKSHHRKHSQSDDETESETLEVKSLENDVESLENKIKKLEQAQEASESEGTHRSKKSSPEKENQLRIIRNLPLPKEGSNSESEYSPKTPELASEDSPKTPNLASEDSDDTLSGKSSGEDETWEELKQKWEEKLKTKQKS